MQILNLMVKSVYTTSQNNDNKRAQQQKPVGTALHTKRKRMERAEKKTHIQPYTSTHIQLLFIIYCPYRNVVCTMPVFQIVCNLHSAIAVLDGDFLFGFR